MIRLRETSVRWLCHPLVGPVLILCLAVALAFLAVHEVGEGSVESLLAACATLAAFAAVGARLLRGESRLRSGPALLTGAPARHAPSRRDPAVHRAFPLRL